MEKERTPAEIEATMMGGTRLPSPRMKCQCQGDYVAKHGKRDNNENSDVTNNGSISMGERNIETDNKEEKEERLMMVGGTVVELNVGGSFFATTVNTLEACRYFHVLVSGPFHKKRDKEGRIFIDRNGTLFEHILDFLRDGQIYLPDNRLDLHYRLLAEAGFYGLNELVDLLNLQIEALTKKQGKETQMYQDITESITSLCTKMDTTFRAQHNQEEEKQGEPQTGGEEERESRHQHPQRTLHGWLGRPPSTESNNAMAVAEARATFTMPASYFRSPRTPYVSLMRGAEGSAVVPRVDGGNNGETREEEEEELSQPLLF